MKKTSTIIIGFLTLAAIAYGAATAFRLYMTPPQVLKKVTVRLAWLNNAQFAGMYVAKEKGFYKNAGLDVEFKEFDSNADPMAEIEQGKAQFGIVTPIELFKARDDGHKIKALAAIYQDSPYAFVSLKGSSIKAPLDFRGKVLGLKGGSNIARVNYSALLRRYGIAPADVTFKNLDFSEDESQDLVKRKADVVDIYRTDQTYLLDKNKIDYNLILPEKFGFPSYGDLLVTSDALVDEQPDFAGGFTGATIEGWSYALAHEDEALAIVLKYASGRYADAEYERYILDKSRELIHPSLGSQIGNMQFIRWNQSFNAAVDSGMIVPKFDIIDSYTTRFIYGI